jgi:hypothetical protein
MNSMRNCIGSSVGERLQGINKDQIIKSLSKYDIFREVYPLEASDRFSLFDAYNFHGKRYIEFVTNGYLYSIQR